MLTEMQFVVAGMRKHSCGDVAAYAAVCCFSDVGVAVGSGWKADEENLDYTEVEQQDSQQQKGKFAKKGLKLAANVVKSASAFAKDSARRMSSSDSGSKDSVSRTSSSDSGSEHSLRRTSSSDSGSEHSARRRTFSYSGSDISRIYAVPGRLYA